MSGDRDPIDVTLASHLNMRLTRLAEERNIQLERLLDKLTNYYLNIWKITN
ncbi:hypothetical protein [Peribacillus butanolivorans]|uniref:hypothetical protein n=1 Tax=Peribacillus butanolivorans TaxID=421767 RepID=UPI0036C64AF0